MGLHEVYGHLCELQRECKLKEPFVKEFFDSFVTIENEERDKHYVGADDSNVSLTDVPSTSLQKPIVHNAMSATSDSAARHLTEDMLVRIKEAVDTDEKVCVPDLLGSQCDGTCSIVHDQISWALGMGITLYLREKLGDETFQTPDLLCI